MDRYVTLLMGEIPQDVRMVFSELYEGVMFWGAMSNLGGIN